MSVNESGLLIPEVTWDIDTTVPINSPDSGETVPFDQKVYDVVYAAANHGMGVAYGSTRLPEQVHQQIEGAQELLDGARPADYNQHGSRYWSVIRVSGATVFRQQHKDFASQQGAIVSDALNRKARRIKAVLNVFSPLGEGEPHTDDFFTVVYAKGDTILYTLDHEDKPTAQGDIKGSGIAAFCGEFTPRRIGFHVEPKRHKVDNPSSTNERASLGVSYTFSPLMVSWPRFIATEMLGIRK